jgi:hypothetical protein
LKLMPLLTITNTISGKNAVAGVDAAICTRGCKKFAKRGLEPISTPSGIVHAIAISIADSTRSAVATVPAATRP